MFSLVGPSFVKEEEKQIQYGSIGNNELPNIEEIVKRILASEKIEDQKKQIELESEKSPFAQRFKKEDSYWQDQEELYLEIEQFVRENNDKIPSWQIAGPLNYGMSLEQMKDAITRKFKEMASSGKLITEEQLTKNQNREFFYPTAGRGNNNLTRIWGAEFLRSNLVNHTTLNAAEHFLIVDDSASEIEVEVWHSDYPILSIVNNAHVLSQKIDGVRKATEYRSSSKLNELRYRDFKDPGNIICDSNGIGWIVDTEMKSFDAPKLSKNSNLIQNYLKKRFKLLAGEEYSCVCQTFKISIADLKLK